MSSMILNYNSKQIAIKHSKISVWMLRIKSIVYIIAFFTLMTIILYKESSSVSVIAVTVFSMIFLFIVFKDRKRFSDKKFHIEFQENGININHVYQIETKKLEKIILKKTVATYSASPYYDVYVIFLGIKYLVIDGVSEADKDQIIKTFKSFFNVRELPVEVN
jgi:hypothetical protein